MYDLHRDLIEALKATPETLTGLLSGISEAQAHSATGGDENWSVVEVICHLRDADEVSVQRVEAMRDLDTPAILNYDQEAMAIEHNYKAAELQPTLAEFEAQRQRLLTILSDLTPEQWERAGQHSEFGRITILGHTIHKVNHDAIHCAQIARQLSNAE